MPEVPANASNAVPTKDRLATTDASGARLFLYPSAVRGYFYRRKLWIHAGLILLFLGLPWLRVHGRPLLLLDVAHREFYFFGLHFRAHDAPLVLLLLLGFTFAIGFVTAIWGRLWCGWACPQTVFTEFLFRRIERWIEGGPRERRELDEGPWTSAKWTKKGAKWGAFLVISLFFTHSFLAYFVGSGEVLAMVLRPPAENWASFLVVAFTTLLLLFDFGWFREQFCVIVCPYGRFQSVMLGASSLVVAYDEKRGEPRRGLGFLPQGDCVNCLRCVQVCPTGIDIRRGLQMECVACTACIDACDEVMTKIKKPLGLIRYQTLAESLHKPKPFNGRAWAYGALCLAVILTAVWILSRKDFLEVTALRAQGAPYELVHAPGGDLVVNHYHLEISNQTGGTRVVKVVVSPGYPTGIELVMPMNPVELIDGAKQRVDFFLKIPRSSLRNGAARVNLRLEANSGTRELEVPIVGPLP